MIHNELASVVSLAKTIRVGLDRSAPTSSLPTSSLMLILTTFIEQAEVDNPTARKIGTSREKFVQSRIAGIEDRRS